MMQRPMEVRALDFQLSQQRELRTDGRRRPKKILKAGSFLMIFISAWLMTGSAWAQAMEKDHQQKQHPDLIGVSVRNESSSVSALVKKSSKEMDYGATMGAASVAAEKAASLQNVSPEQEAEEAAVEAIEQLGGRVRYEGNGGSGPVVSVVFFGARVTDADLKKLKNLLSNLKKLTSLQLSSEGVTNAGLKELQNLQGLTSLAISSRGVTDAGLKELRSLKGLQELWLGSTGVTDAGLKELQNVEGLRDLYLNDTGVTDAGLKELGKLKGLQLLLVNGTRVTDAGLKELKDLKGLQRLFLQNTQTTDAGLKELEGLKQLRVLELHDTRVTAAGVAKLKKALPELRIHWKYDDIKE